MQKDQALSPPAEGLAALATELNRPPVDQETARRIEIAKEARELGASLRKDVAPIQSSYSLSW